MLTLRYQQLHCIFMILILLIVYVIS